jgi:hypothetical protein
MMKKLLLLLCLIFVSILAFPQGAAASSSITTATLTAAQTSAIEITITGTESPWTLTPATTFVDSPSSLSVVVNSTGDWSVAASDVDTSHTNGYMTQYASGAYTPSVHLTNPLMVEATSGTDSGHYVTLPLGGAIVTGLAGTNQVSYPLGFQQVVSYADPTLSTGTYRIVVTLTGTAA